MIALKVQINDSSPVIAGADDLGVLTAIVSCVGKLGPLSDHVGEDDVADLAFKLRGLTSPLKGATGSHLIWLERNGMKLGDTVTIEIVETDHSAQPISGKEAERIENDEHAYFNHCKRAYLEMRHKYEIED